MKKILFLSFILLALFSCRQELTEDLLPEEEVTRQKVTLSFALSHGMENSTEIQPMSRADENGIKTLLYRKYNIIVIKKTEKYWVIDTVISRMLPGSRWQTTLEIKGPLIPEKLQIALTPGQYKIAVFFNVESMNWRNQPLPGTIVSDREDISCDDNLIPACLYTVQTNKEFINLDQIMLGREPFSGYTSFTLEKNKDLETEGSHPSFLIEAKRRVSKYRYLLQDNLEKQFYDQFITTQHTFEATFTAQNGQKFCDGLNVLGGVYYDLEHPRTQLRFILTAGSEFRTSPYNQIRYQLPQSNGTYFHPFIITDEKLPSGLTCMISDITISGQSGRKSYQCLESFTHTFKPNQIRGNIFKAVEEYIETEKIIDGRPVEIIYVRIKEVPGEVTQLFDPYVEWNYELY